MTLTSIEVVSTCVPRKEVKVVQHPPTERGLRNCILNRQFGRRNIWIEPKVRFARRNTRSPSPVPHRRVAYRLGKYSITNSFSPPTTTSAAAATTTLSSAAAAASVSAGKLKRGSRVVGGIDGYDDTFDCSLSSTTGTVTTSDFFFQDESNHSNSTKTTVSTAGSLRSDSDRTGKGGRAKGVMKFRTNQESLARSFRLISDEQRRVGFSDVTVHYHPIILGMNPAVSNGPPLTIDWMKIESISLAVETHENSKAGRPYRVGRTLKIGQVRRELLLKSLGYTRDDFLAVARHIRPIQESRSRNAGGEEFSGGNNAASTGSHRVSAGKVPSFLSFLVAKPKK